MRFGGAGIATKRIRAGKARRCRAAAKVHWDKPTARRRIEKLHYGEMRILVASIFLLVSSWLVSGALGEEASVPAFPGAQGFGADTPGGRGGQVLIVSNLNDAGPGSFRAACEAKGPRIVVFRVSGLIDLQSPVRITEPFVTIAGQSAPGAGICLKRNGLSIDTHDVVVRHIRSRPGDISGKEVDGLAVGGSSRRVIIDHCSVSWSVDENLSPSGNIADVTVQWSIISEALNRSVHGKGAHGYGSLVRASGGVSLQHNLWASNASRNPRPGDNYGRPPFPTIDVRSNVIDNPGGGNVIGETVTINFAGNHIRPGRDTNLQAMFGPTAKYSIRAFVAGNVVEGMPGFKNWFSKPVEMLDAAAGAPRITAGDARTESLRVLEAAGATLPLRDSVDARVVAAVRSGKGRIIDSQWEVGGWPEYRPAPPPADTDRDGMPDEWERARGLDPKDARDAGLPAKAGGYSNIEIYLNTIGGKPAGQIKR